MTLDTVLTIALDVGFFALFAFALLDYLRHRGRARLVVMLTFGSLAAVLAMPLIARAVPTIAPVSSLIVLPALLAQPALVLWLVSLLRPIPRAVLASAVIAFVGLTAGFIWLLATGVQRGTPAVTALSIALLAYFLVFEGGGALGLAAAARQRGGASRTRLRTAAVSTGLFAGALVVLLAVSLVAAPDSPASTATNVIARLMALLSAVGFLAAFAPPRALRQLSQQGTVYNFIRDLNALPAGTSADRIFELLTDTAKAASGASRTAVVLDGAPPAKAAPGSRVVTLPFDSERWPAGHLELELPEHALFLEDDLELIGLVLDRGIRAAERESFAIERERLISDLQAASAAKSDFLAAMSHELRTPLNAIIGFSELLSEGGDDAADPGTVATYSEHIHGSGLHLLDLVNDVLDLARVEAGRLDLKPIRFELDGLVRQTVATMQPLAVQKQLSIASQLSPISIDADMGRIRQVVLNLLSNAVKFTNPGGEIRISLVDDGGDQVRLSVADTGQGIAARDLDRIFEAFQQGDGMATHHEGTGLGLALTRQLVEAHGGSIGVTSVVGVGSEFTVLLPVSGRTAEVTERAPALPAGRPSVLVIEDDPAARELLRVHLEGAGYGVVATESGRQGLAWVGELHPDAVVLDILLPDLDGWEILSRLKGDPVTRAIPVMVVSVVDDRKLGLALGAVDYLVKPVSRELLLESLGRLTFTTKVKTRTVTALVIDQDPDAASRYRQLLEPDGFRVIGAVDGASGRRMAVEDRPDLIVLDSSLPDVDGFELAATLRHDPATSSIPVWLTTPSGLAPEAKARLNGNVQGVLERGDEALEALRGWLEAGPPRGTPTEAKA